MARHDASDTNDLWAEAIRELDESDRALIWGHAADRLNVLDDVLTSAKNKEKESKEKRWKYKKRDGTKGELYTLFNRVVDKVSRFKQLGDSIVALDPTHLTIPWTAVGLGLQIAVNYFEHSNLAQEGMQMLAVLVPRYTVFESLYLGEDSQIKKTMKSELVRLYSRALTFVAKLKTYHERGTVRNMIHSVWTPDQLEELIDEVRSQQAIVDDLGRLVDAERSRDAANKTQSGLGNIQGKQDVLRKALGDFQHPIQEIKDGMVDLVRNLKAQEEMEVLNWLSRVSYNKYHQGLRINRLKGTGIWIFDQPQYKKWRTSKDSSILWLQGQPGTGKSTLMSLIIDSVRENQTTSQANPLAYIYCSRNVANHRDDEPEALTRNIIKQLSRLEPGKPIRGAVVRKYQDLQEHGYGNEVMVFPDTRNLLLQLVDEGTTMVFVDAVDECTPNQQKELFQLVKSLLEPHAKRVVKILISSRPSLEISTHLRVFKNSYTIDAGRNCSDIQMFAQLKASEFVEDMKLRKIYVSNNLQQTLAEALVNGAQGMFLWIKLQADLLNDPKQTTFQEDVLRRVREAPTGLSRLYSAIYKRIEEGGSKMRETAVTMIHWLLCAAEPLGRSELRAALSKHVKTESLSEEIILESCSNLVMIDEGLNTFRFIHTSVKDFFETEAEFSTSKRNATAADVCLREIIQGVTIPPRLSLQRESLHCYAILYWVSHVEKAGLKRPTITIEDAIRDLCLADGDIRPWFRHWLEELRLVCHILEWNDPFKDKVLQALSSPETSFFAACAFGFVEVVERYREIKPALFRAENEMGATGLHLACQYGHLAVTEELLNGRADADAKDKYGETALIRACYAGHDSIVEFLLRQGANAKIQGRRFGTALQAAALHGHLSIVRQLVKNGVDIEAEGGQFGTALQAASVRGHLQVVKELLALGADVNAPGGDYKTIHETAPTGSIADGVRQAVEYILKKQDVNDRRFHSDPTMDEASMQLLLDRTLDINLKKSGFGPAIHAASRAGHTDVVEELTAARGLDVNSEGGRYGSCLQAAAVSGRLSIVATLFKAGADVNSQNGTFGSPLAAACRRSHYDIAQFLIENGADVDIQAGVYGTPLQAAARSGNCHIVRLLLEKGANPNLVAGMYGTPLQAAARDDFSEIIAVCLDNSADPGIEGGSFGTALQAASGAGHLKSMQLLLGKGVKVGAALQVASFGGHRDVVACLLEHGAAINSEYRGFGTPIEAAVAGNHLDLVRFLVKESEAVDYPPEGLGAALELAAVSGDEPLTKALLKRGADPVCGRRYINNKLGGVRGSIGDEHYWEHPLQCAAMQGYEDVLRILLDKVKPSDHWGESAIGDALASAARSGHINIVRLLLNRNIQQQYQSNALSKAAKGGHESILRLMLEHGVRITSATLEEACVQGNTKLLAFLLQERRKYQDQKLAGSLLLGAALQGNSDIVNILLQNGVKVNALVDCDELEPYRMDNNRSSDGSEEEDSRDSEDSDMDVRPMKYRVTPLHGAVFAGHEPIVNLLIKHGASLRMRGRLMPAVLQVASSLARVNIVKTLINLRANINERSGKYGTALQAAAFAGSKEVVRTLLEHGADVNQEGGEFGTALQAAAAKGDEAVVQQLLGAGADVQREGGPPNESGEETVSWLAQIPNLGSKEPGRRQNGKFGTSLQAAADSGNIEIVRLLLDRGADFGDTDKYGQTPLHRAACHGHEAVVALLLERGANPNREDCKGRSSIIMAASNGWKAVITHLTGAGATPLSMQESCDSALHHAASNGHVTILEQLLGGGYDVDMKNHRGQTALMMAAREGWTSAVRFLLDSGSNINHRDGSGCTAVSEAVQHGHSAIVRLLLTRGANLNERDNHETGLLRLAMHELSDKVIRPGSEEFQVFYLLAKHPSIQLELRNKSGATALHIAAGMRNPDLMAILLDRGADIEARDSAGRTPLHYCVTYAKQSLPEPTSALQYLVNKGANINAETNDGKNVWMVARDHLSYSVRQTTECLGLLEVPSPVMDSDRGLEASGIGLERYHSYYEESDSRSSGSDDSKSEGHHDEGNGSDVDISDEDFQDCVEHASSNGEDKMD